MRVVALGVSHRTARVDLREELARAGEALEDFVAGLGEVRFERVALSTCNRFELYLAFPADAAVPPVEEWPARLIEALGVAVGEEAFYLVEGADAARHLYRVAASLDSQVLGEDQILGQVKAAFQDAVDREQTGPVLNHLFHQAFRIAKRVRSETEIGRHPVSIASAGVRLARKVFGDLHGRRILVLGVGEMGRLTLRHLREEGATDVVVVNRTLSRGAALAEEFGAEVRGLDRLGEELPRADVVVAATGATAPVLDRAAVAAAVDARGPTPLLLVDLGIPRDVEPGVHELEGVFLYDLDDLEEVTAESRNQRAAAAEQGEQLVADAALLFGDWVASRAVVPVISELQERLHALAARELEKSLKRVADVDPTLREACERAVRSVVAKLLHHPMITLRGLPPDERRQVTLSVVKNLFQLDGNIPNIPEGDAPSEAKEVSS